MRSYARDLALALTATRDATIRRKEHDKGGAKRHRKVLGSPPVNFS